MDLYYTILFQAPAIDHSFETVLKWKIETKKGTVGKKKEVLNETPHY